MPIIKGTQSITPIYKGDIKIDKIYKGLDLVYQSITTESLYYILNVSSVDSSGVLGVEFNLTVGSNGATVTFNGEEKVLDSTAKSVLFETSSAGITGDIVFKGDFSNVRASSVVINNIVQFPLGITEIYENQFAGQYVDFIINVPNTVTKINLRAFNKCSFDSNSALNFGNDVNEIVAVNDRRFIGYFGNAIEGGEITLSSGKTSTLYSINDWIVAYRSGNTVSLTGEVILPESTKGLANYLFQDVYEITSIVFPTTHSITKIPDYFCDGASGLTSITIPSGVETIGLSAFETCTGLVTVSLPSSVRHIGERAFYSCGGLTSLTVPSSIETIENSAFSGCSGLTSLTIPNSVKTLGNNAFSGCTKLTDVTIPASISKIGNVAFGQTATDAIFRFLQPSGMAVELPTAGVNGMFYYKSAQTITIYTDNETIKNYDYSADNKTATIYHLDGTAWE